MVDENGDVGLNERKFMHMVKLYNFFMMPENRKRQWRSLNQVGQVFENSPVVTDLSKDTLGFMQRQHLIIIADVNALVFDQIAFEEFMESSYWGKLLFRFVDDCSMVRF